MKKDFLLLALSAAFLVNPTVNIIDPVPDFIGYILLFIGMRKLCRDEDSLSEARKKAFVLAAISAVKLVLQLSFPDMTAMARLTVTFVAAIVEAIVFIPMISGYLNGMTYLLTRHGSDDNTADPNSLKRYSIISFIVRDAAALLPLLPTLSDNSYVFGDGESSFSHFTDIYYVFAGIVVLAVSIPWAVKFIKLHKKMASDEKFIRTLSEKYEKEVLAYPNRITAGSMTKMLVLTVVASAFLFAFYADNVNIFPNFISAVLFAPCFALTDFAPKKLRIAGVISDGVWAVMAYIGLKLQIDFAAENYTPEWALHDIGKSAEMYTKIEILSAIEATFMAASSVLLIICLFKAVGVHKTQVINPERVRGTEKCVIPFAIFLSLVTLLNFFIAPIMKYFPEIWMINGALVIALAVCAYRMYRSLTENLYHRMSI